MDWIESRTTIVDHPKTRKLARKLGIPIAAVVGHLHCLWHWAAKYARDGDLSRFDVDDIAYGARWDCNEYGVEADSTMFCAALVEIGWIDEGPTRLHDWWDFAGRFLEKQESVQEASAAGTWGNHKRWHVGRGVIAPDCRFCRGDNAPESPPESGPDIHNTTTPDLTVPNTTSSDGGDVDNSKTVENPKTARIVSDVAAALADDFVFADLQPGLQALRDGLVAGQSITRPVAYVRKIADKTRAAREASERASSPIIECPHCERHLRQRDLQAHIHAEHPEIQQVSA